MLYTTGQLRSAFRLSKQQWRSFRDALPPLARDNSRAACFTTADLLATGVIHRISTSLSIPLSVFTAIAAPLYQLCASSAWPMLERSTLVIDLEGNRVELVDNKRRITPTPLAIMVELAPLVAGLRQHVLADTTDEQQDLAFPPMIASVRR